MIVWHYTVAVHFPKIVECGALLPVDPSHIDDRATPTLRAEMRHLYGNEKAALWFSARQDWEPTANKGNATSRAETFEVGRGLVRFGIDETRVPFGWAYHVRTSGIRRKGARQLERAGRACGANPSDWRVSYEPIPVGECVVEVFNAATGEWERIQEAAAAAETWP